MADYKKLFKIIPNLTEDISRNKKAIAQFEAEAEETAMKKAKQKGLDETFNALPEAEKSAQESAEIFNKDAPNFDLVDKTTPVSPEQSLVPRASTIPEQADNFKLVEPEVMPSSNNLPALSSASNPTSDIVDAAKSSQPSKYSNVLKSLGILSGTGAAVYGMSKGEPASIQPPTAPVIPTPNESQSEQSQVPQQEPSALSKLQGALKPVPSSITPDQIKEATDKFTLDLGENNQNYKQQLADAQQQQRETVAANQFLKGIELMSTGIIGSGAKPVAQELFNQNIKNSDRPIKELEERMTLEKNDPNSPLSKAFKQYASKLGVEIKGELSAADGEKLLPYIFKGYEAQEQRKAKALEAQLKREELIETRKERQRKEGESSQTKLDSADTKRFDELGKRLVAETSSSRSVLGRAANNKRAAEAIQTLMDQYKGRENEMDKRQVQEVAKSLDALLSQGQPTVSGTSKLVPETFKGDASKIAEYILNIPRGAQQQDFIKRMGETVAREKELAQNQIKNAQGKILAPYKDLSKRHPEMYNDILNVHDLDTSGEESSVQSKEQTKKTVIKKGYNPKTNQTQLIYSDGTKEIVQGKQ